MLKRQIVKETLDNLGKLICTITSSESCSWHFGGSLSAKKVANKKSKILNSLVFNFVKFGGSYFGRFAKHIGKN